MKQLFLKLTDSKSRYWIFDNAQTKNFLLSNLVWFLEAWGDRKTNPLSDCRKLTWEWLHLRKTEDDKMVYLWSSFSIKNQAELSHLNSSEQKAFDDAYDDYYEKRWDDIPKLYMSMQNYVEIVQKWQNIVLEQRPNYILLSQDDSGYVDLIGKDELSEQDLDDMKIEHEKYLKYKAAYDKYTKSRPDITDDLWYGPESSEFEADWQKFLDEPLD
jgi:hypothetical protein